jgi:hypothetical protein
MNKLLASSVDPNQLSLSVKGALTLVLPLFVLLAKTVGVTFAEGDLETLIEATSNTVAAVGFAVSAVLTLWGLVRKVLVAFRG